MHAHAEILIPPTDAVEEAVQQVLAPFSENAEHAYQPFWDWYVIGGRWDRAHDMARLDDEKLEEFTKVLREKKLTVSSVQCGAPKLEPESQEGEVDDLWNKWFPESGMSKCPFFQHGVQQYNSPVEANTHPLWNVPPDLTCSRFISASPRDRDGFGKLKSDMMLVTETWNAVSHQKTDWDGTIKAAVERVREFFDGHKRLTHEQFKHRRPQDDWLLVTVDYHS